MRASRSNEIYAEFGPFYERDQWRINHWIEVWGCNMHKAVNHWVYLDGKFYKAETSYEIFPLPIY